MVIEVYYQGQSDERGEEEEEELAMMVLYSSQWGKMEEALPRYEQEEFEGIERVV